MASVTDHKIIFLENKRPSGGTDFWNSYQRTERCQNKLISQFLSRPMEFLSIAGVESIKIMLSLNKISTQKPQLSMKSEAKYLK